MKFVFKGDCQTKAKSRKIIALTCVVFLVSTLFFSTPVNAVQSPYKIDGAYVTGSTNYYSTFVSATTTHKTNYIKNVKVYGYCFMSGNLACYGTATNADYAPNYVTVSFDMGSFTPIGSKGEHSVDGSTWVGKSYSGIYMP